MLYKSCDEEKDNNVDKYWDGSAVWLNVVFPFYLWLLLSYFKSEAAGNEGKTLSNVNS